MVWFGVNGAVPRHFWRTTRLNVTLSLSLPDSLSSAKKEEREIQKCSSHF